MQILELAQNVLRLFEYQEPHENRRLLNFVLSNCTWGNGELVAAFRQPFDLLAKATPIAMQSAADDRAILAKKELWRPRLI